ncbi:hypothetical protein [Burkholderia sp. IDO3]|uniref:hypothetical protein n=1 Tax=Burkholderia sp. IDO3 TaxID=1705310 RepID=UPI000BBB0DAE|nr:hypothetical protein [Burkholderia sp. IDO3]AXK67578.1 hypothetical protein DCN14_33755 [Burkholderia sp. IDO3]PCD57098.1 hypothetical protein CN645_35970 [Burkholderia sp. IDO3]
MMFFVVVDEQKAGAGARGKWRRHPGARCAALSTTIDGRVWRHHDSRAAAYGIARPAAQLDAIAAGSELREYVTTHYLLLYALIEGTVHLLAIRHQRHVSFDPASHWPT